MTSLAGQSLGLPLRAFLMILIKGFFCVLFASKSTFTGGKAAISDSHFPAAEEIL
jgi:hypothetical protein